jgi:hypothetical protein
VHRELPEAARQVREAQEAILTAAGAMLTLTEALENNHRKIEELLHEAGTAHFDLEKALIPLMEASRRGRGLIVELYEKMNFQDLSGQRLAKAEAFFQSLREVMNRFVGPRPARPGTSSGVRPGGRGEPKRPWSRGPQAVAAGTGGRGGPKKSRLKGPQAPGQGLRQADVDLILKDK